MLLNLAAHLLDFVPQMRGLFEILVFDGLGQFLLQALQAVRQIAALAQ